MTRTKIFACSFVLAALPLFASSGRQRAAAVPATVTVHGVVRDSNGMPVVAAYVHNGTFDPSAPHIGNGTNANGVYAIALPAGRPAVLTVEDFQFEPATVSVTPAADMTLDLTLTTPRPLVTVTLLSGESHVLVTDSVKFAWYRVFADYAKFDNANVCKTDGSSFAPNKKEIAKIVGPFTRVNFSPCCGRGPVITATMQMKTGETMQVYFNDSCYDDELDFIGRERVTGTWYYLKFDDIAEIDFQ